MIWALYLYHTNIVAFVTVLRPEHVKRITDVYQEMSYLWRTSLYLAASASAEFFADIMLCPMEALKVRIQTQPGWANNFRQGLPKLMAEEGLWG